jgi:hypothetical protein
MKSFTVSEASPFRPNDDCGLRRSVISVSIHREQIESTAIVKHFSDSTVFLIPPLPKTVVTDTLQATGAEDKPLLGSKLSADSGTKTRLGFGEN